MRIYKGLIIYFSFRKEGGHRHINSKLSNLPSKKAMITIYSRVRFSNLQIRDKVREESIQLIEFKV